MKQRYLFGTRSEAALREAVQIMTTIIDLGRKVQLLEVDIAAEEERSQLSDRSDPAYPVLARMLAARRDNLKATIAALEQRLAHRWDASSETKLLPNPGSFAS